MKILFLLKKNLIYGTYNSVIAKSGLLNSATITSHQLEKHFKVCTELEVCVDGNEVDKFLHKHKPRVCIIEALWVTPAKIYELVDLHKTVIFIILVHSEVAFLANEGNAVSWIYGYNAVERCYPAFNSKKTFEQFRKIGIEALYLPNIYLDVKNLHTHPRKPDGIVDISSFGAVRPFKNQLIQAMASIVFADKNDLILRFHMNTSRMEQGGEGVMKNIRALFYYNDHSLVEHGWKDRQEFLKLIRGMDIGLQVSFTESFNIVAADFVKENVPVVVSKTIDWMPESQQVSTEDLDAIVEALEDSLKHRERAIRRSVRFLQQYNKMAQDVWEKFLQKFWV